MAGTAPTGFHFTITLDAGPVYCGGPMQAEYLFVARCSRDQFTSRVTSFAMCRVLAWPSGSFWSKSALAMQGIDCVASHSITITRFLAR